MPTAAKMPVKKGPPQPTRRHVLAVRARVSVCPCVPVCACVYASTYVCVPVCLCACVSACLSTCESVTSQLGCVAVQAAVSLGGLVSRLLKYHRRVCHWLCRPTTAAEVKVAHNPTNPRCGMLVHQGARRCAMPLCTTALNSTSAGTLVGPRRWPRAAASTPEWHVPTPPPRAVFLAAGTGGTGGHGHRRALGRRRNGLQRQQIRRRGIRRHRTALPSVPFFDSRVSRLRSPAAATTRHTICPAVAAVDPHTPRVPCHGLRQATR